MPSLKPTHIYDRPPPPQGNVPAPRDRNAQAHPLKLATVEGVVPQVDRRVASRRVMERREKEQSLFLDTRMPQGRRRSPGRRAEDLEGQPRMTISVRA